MNVEPCNVCGGTEVNLVDGYYYCVECGTQDANVRETVLEERALADGTFAISRHKKVAGNAEETEEMSGEWHKWHAYNFMLSGLADELIAAGAKPTFKMKLLWLWTKYIKKFQNKEELGLTKDDRNGNLHEPESDEEDSHRKTKERTKKRSSYRALKTTSDLSVLGKGVLCSLIYAALNLDKSEIQLSDLLRYKREGRVNFKNCLKYVPKEIKFKLVPQWEAFITSKIGPLKMHIMVMSVFKCLNIAPVLPDLKLIVNRFTKELCLPKDFKNLVLSLMNLVPCDSFLDVDKSMIKSLLRIPPYEYTVMAYFLVAFKMCFGLDDNYEVKISDAVENINDENCYLKSYKLGGYCEPTDRLFSFREWCSFIQLRKIILCKYYLHMAEQYALDIDDYVYMEQCQARKKVREPLLSDEITMNLLDKIPQINTAEVIPKSEFKATLTPFSCYTDLVLQYFHDPDLRLLFSEDFTQYSLKYACEKLSFSNENDVKNIIIGVDETKKVINKQIYGRLEETTFDTKMVYVRNCENKNWLKTNQPTVKHIKKVNRNNSDRESDHGYDSNSENTPPVEIESSKDEESSNHDSEVDVKEDIEVDKKLEIIEEEDIDKNIFDDDFEGLVFVEQDKILEEDEIKTEEPEESENVMQSNDQDEIDHNFDNHVPDNQDSKSDISHNDLDLFYNPNTFDRSKTIRELILATCKKYQIRIPNEYNTKEPVKRKRKLVNDMAGVSGAKRSRLEDGKPKRQVAKRGEAREQVHNLLSDYYKNLQHDVMFQISEHVKSVINASRAQESNEIEENNQTQETDRRDDTAEGDENEQTNLENEENFDTEHMTENIETSNINLDQSSLNIVENEEEEDDSQIRGDPKFDEKEYDTRQLYVKVGDDPVSDSDVFDDPVLNAILDKKIEELSKYDVPPSEAAPDSEKETSDSESDDDVPLSVLKEEKAAMHQSTVREKLQPLVSNKENITEFKYWTRFYASEKVRKLYELNEPFNLELEENFPVSFQFVIKECAGILDCSPFLLYKSMVALEQRMLSHNR